MRGIRRLSTFAGFFAVAGACGFVCGPAVAQAQPVPHGVIQKFDANGLGTGLATPLSSCPPGASVGDTCYGISGNVSGDPIGNGTFTGTLDVSNVTVDNGSSGLCAPASGTMTLSFNGSKQSITMGFVGDYCDIAQGSLSAASEPTTLNGNFFVTGGSGSRFSKLNGDYASGGAGAGTLVISGDSLIGSLALVLKGILEFALQ